MTLNKMKPLKLSQIAVGSLIVFGLASCGGSGSSNAVIEEPDTGPTAIEFNNLVRDVIAQDQNEAPIELDDFNISETTGDEDFSDLL